jgi:hypothetical protein
MGSKIWYNYFNWHGGGEVTQRSAKPLHAGSNPARASARAGENPQQTNKQKALNLNESERIDDTEKIWILPFSNPARA